MPAAMSVWFPVWNRLLESMGLSISTRVCKFCFRFLLPVNPAPGWPGEGTLRPQITGWCCASPTSCCEGGNRVPKGLLRHPLAQEKGLAEWPGCGARRGLSRTRGDPRAGEVPADALQSWLHPGTRPLVPFCSQTFNIQCQVVLCYVMLLCYARRPNALSLE